MAVCFYSRIIISIIFIFLLFLMPVISVGQTSGCDYDKNAPSLKHARILFKSLNYICAEEEILDFIGLEATSYREKADAHALLAAVYYAMIKDRHDKKERVADQFTKAFRVFKDWQGELDIRSTEFQAMMEEAGTKVEQEPETVTEIIETRPTYRPECPLSKTALISTAAFAGSTIFYMISTGSANDKWAEYATNWESGSPYDTYESASNTRQFAQVLSIGTGLFTAYQWWQYFKATRKCKRHNANIGDEKGLKLDIYASQVRLSCHF